MKKIIICTLLPIVLGLYGQIEDVGEDAMIVGEQLDEWKGWCSKGKLP